MEENKHNFKKQSMKGNKDKTIRLQVLLSCYMDLKPDLITRMEINTIQITETTFLRSIREAKILGRQRN
jgi:hypothetical protein